MKDELRNKIKIKRRYFQNVQRAEADRVIAETFMQAFGNYRSFLIYNSFAAEADTSRIISMLVAAGKSVYLPRVEGENIVAAPFGDTKEGAFGIREPTGQAFSGDIEVTVAPLLAVNAKGYRIGYGKGFYDRYFKKTRTLKVGLGYAFQMEEFIEDEWDEPLDKYICEKGIYDFGK